jgi:hypothetical protein
MGFLDFHQNHSNKSTRPNHSNQPPLCEAVFSEDNIEKAVLLMKRTIERKFGSKFYAIGFEDFSSTLHGKGKGYRLINNSGTQIRFNWVPSDSPFVISAIDYWRTDNNDFTQPTLSVVFGEGLNIVKVIDKIMHDVKRGKIGKFSVDENLHEDIKSKTGDVSYYEIMLGKEETNSIVSNLMKVEDQYNNTPYSKPETCSLDIENEVDSVALKYTDSLIISGIDKTYDITPKLNEILGEAGKEWVYFKGLKASPLGLYSKIYLNRDKLLVFDDSDSLLENVDCTNMLKDILNSSGVREVSWVSPSTVNTSTMSTSQYNQFIADLDKTVAKGPGLIGKDEGKLPSKIFFTGRVIFLSAKKASAFDDAFKSNSTFVDVNLHLEDTIRRIKTVALVNAASDGVSTDDIDEIIDSLTPDTELPKIDVQYVVHAFMKDGKPLTIRAYYIALSLRKSKLPDWDNIVTKYV